MGKEYRYKSEKKGEGGASTSDSRLGGRLVGRKQQVVVNVSLQSTTEQEENGSTRSRTKKACRDVEAVLTTKKEINTLKRKCALGETHSATCQLCCSPRSSFLTLVDWLLVRRRGTVKIVSTLLSCPRVQAGPQVCTTVECCRRCGRAVSSFRILCLSPRPSETRR